MLPDNIFEQLMINYSNCKYNTKQYVLFVFIREIIIKKNKMISLNEVIRIIALLYAANFLYLHIMDVYHRTEVKKKRRNSLMRSYDLVMKNW